MSLEDFIDIRFGDPVISLTLNSEALVYGTMMGRLLYYNFSPRFERVLTEISDEYIAGAWLSEENTLYACIGDLKAVVIENPGGETYTKQYVQFDKIHTTVSCELSQIKIFKDSVLLATLEPILTSDSLTHISSPLFIIKLIEMQQVTVEGVRFLPHTVFFDFDGKKLLYLEFQEQHRVLSFYRVDKGCSEIKVMGNGFGKLGFAKIWGKKIVYVHGQRVLRIMDRKGKDLGEIGRHEKYVVALNCVRIEVNDSFRKRISIGEPTEDKSINRNEERRYREYLISVDFCGQIKIWGDDGLIEEIFISKLAELTEKYRTAQYFSMGYPYYIAASSSRIALSTDLGVLIIKSKEFELYSQLGR